MRLIVLNKLVGISINFIKLSKYFNFLLAN